ncbi:DUF445 domain-containing protein [Nakamurella lactea]|uniref:DUF445 domain-containing protein n=1 Tax=Nakamurella lactea TaxID=459515 RepID=UPI0003FABFF3|nr:DUF445 domain-containing protein [Nakamurella lactea]
MSELVPTATAPSAPPPQRPAPPGGARESITDLTPMDRVRRRALVKMKLFATALLAVMAVIFVVAWILQDRYPWLGYVRAAAEAGMVGGLADWFAVTALFRHPMGLKIPHTAIIPERKDAIGSSLSEFVATNFLSEELVREKVSSFGVAQRAGEYLLRPDAAERLVAEAAVAARGLSKVLTDDQVTDLITGLARRRISETRIGPPIGRIAADVFERGEHHPLVDFIVERCYDWIRNNYTVVARVVAQRSPSWSPKFLDSIVADRLYLEVETFAKAVRDDPQHELRKALDTFLSEFAQDLQHDEKTMARVDAIKERVLDNRQVRQLAGEFWHSAKQALLEAIDDPDSALRRSAVQALISFGRSLTEDGPTARRVNTWVADAAGYVAANHARSITGIIDETIARWDGEATSRKIELQIGRDLQFIRINGTVVGSLAGLAIYTIAQLVLG